jgi:hypothetical protein
MRQARDDRLYLGPASRAPQQRVPGMEPGGEGR